MLLTLQDILGREPYQCSILRKGLEKWKHFCALVETKLLKTLSECVELDQEKGFCPCSWLPVCFLQGHFGSITERISKFYSCKQRVNLLLCPSFMALCKAAAFCPHQHLRCHPWERTGLCALGNGH